MHRQKEREERVNVCVPQRERERENEIMGSILSQHVRMSKMTSTFFGGHSFNFFRKEFQNWKNQMGNLSKFLGQW